MTEITEADRQLIARIGTETTEAVALRCVAEFRQDLRREQMLDDAKWLITQGGKWSADVREAIELLGHQLEQRAGVA